MGNFFREYWIWILAPIVIILGILVVLILSTESGSDSPFIYNIW